MHLSVECFECESLTHCLEAGKVAPKVCGLLVCGGQQLLGLQRLPYEYNRNTFVMARKHQNVALIRLDAQNVPPTGIIDKMVTYINFQEPCGVLLYLNKRSVNIWDYSPRHIVFQRDGV